MTRRRALRIALPMLTVLLGALTAGALVRDRRTVEAIIPEVLPPLVRVLEVQTHDVALTVETQGTVQPASETTLVAQVAGAVVEVSSSLAAGGFFERGQVLARIDARDHELALVSARADVARARALLAREEAEAELARSEWQGLGRGEASPLVLHEPQLAEAQAILASASAAEGRAALNLERTRIVAPYSGRVRSEQIDLGQYLPPGAPVAHIYATDYAEIHFPVPDEDLAYLEIPLRRERFDGPRVALSASFAGSRHIWLGHIMRTGGEIDLRSRMVDLVARVEAPYAVDPEHPERPPLAVGLFVSAEIEGRVVSNAIQIPRAAMRTQDELLVVDDDDRIRFRRVEVLRAGLDDVVITAGLRQGERVCLTQLAAPTEGMRVRTLSGPAAPAPLEIRTSPER